MFVFHWGKFIFVENPQVYWIWLIDDTEFKFLFQFDADVT